MLKAMDETEYFGTAQKNILGLSFAAVMPSLGSYSRVFLEHVCWS